DGGDLRRRQLGRCPRRVDDSEDDERDEDVGERAGGDRRHPLPRPLTPVRVVPGSLVDLAQGAIGAASCLPRQVGAVDGAAQLRKQLTGGGEVAAVELAAYALNDRGQLGPLVDSRPDERLEVATGGAVHAGQPREPTERDRAERILDS